MVRRVQAAGRRRGAAVLTAGVIFCAGAVLSVRAVGGGAACPVQEPAAIYAKMKQEMMSHRTYTAVYFHSSERGKRHEIWVKITASGRYIREPARFCEKRLSVEASFPEQAGAGFQECYNGKEDMTRILMPGALRGLGVLPMFPEDPKASYLNGENLKTAAVWTWFSRWDRMLAGGGKITGQCAERRGKPHYVLILQRGSNLDPVYHHDLVKLWVEPQTWFPVREETYVPADPKPVMVYDFTEVKLDVPLTEQDMQFEGLAPGWNLVSAPTGPRLNTLTPEEPKLSEAPDKNPSSFLAALEQALAPVTNYQTVLVLELRYRRLRQYKEDVFKFIKPSSFSALTSRLEANYLLINGGEGFRMVLDTSRDGRLHVLPAGVYKVMGEQTFPVDDPRLFSNMGDNIMDLSFFAIRDELKRRLAQAVSTKTAFAAYRDVQGRWIEVVGKNLGIPQQPTILRLLLNPKTSLPLRLEYRGYDDKSAYLSVCFKETKINPGLKPPDLWK